MQPIARLAAPRMARIVACNFSEIGAAASFPRRATTALPAGVHAPSGELVVIPPPVDPRSGPRTDGTSPGGVEKIRIPGRRCTKTTVCGEVFARVARSQGGFHAARVRRRSRHRAPSPPRRAVPGGSRIDTGTGAAAGAIGDGACLRTDGGTGRAASRPSRIILFLPAGYFPQTHHSRPSRPCARGIGRIRLRRGGTRHRSRPGEAAAWRPSALFRTRMEIIIRWSGSGKFLPVKQRGEGEP